MRPIWSIVRSKEFPLVRKYFLSGIARMLVRDQHHCPQPTPTAQSSSSCSVRMTQTIRQVGALFSWKRSQLEGKNLWNDKDNLLRSLITSFKFKRKFATKSDRCRAESLVFRNDRSIANAVYYTPPPIPAPASPSLPPRSFKLYLNEDTHKKLIVGRGRERMPPPLLHSYRWWSFAVMRSIRELPVLLVSARTKNCRHVHVSCNNDVKSTTIVNWLICLLHLQS